MVESCRWQRDRPVPGPVRQTGPTGFTIVELLVVIGIIGFLVAMILPAVQAAREAARRAQCQNHLKQIATAVLLHEEAHGHFPTGGWGNQWVGDPDRGFAREQPGGWIYNSLPFLDESQLRDLGRAKSGEAKRQALRRMFEHVVPVFYCPSRRTAALYEYTSEPPLQNTDSPEVAPKSDYAVCGGDVVLSGGGGPEDSTAIKLRSYEWPSHEEFTGVAFVLSHVRIGQVIDGTSSTYLVGEKLVEDRWIGDDQGLFVGDDADLRRWTAQPPAQDGQPVEDWFEWFGSAHAAGCYFAMCDGSVQLIAYDIDPETHRRLGNRRDGEIVDLSDL